jgi:histidinol-phosphate/aromatic aminotransferase/cobyric acid decarboxylase-like protein
VVVDRNKEGEVMTDRERLEEFLNKAGVVFESQDNFIEVDSDDGPKNEGYSGFYTIFRFDESGVLESMGAYE